MPRRATAGAPARSGEVTRERILEVATEQFAAKGLAGARVDEIAREARANKQLVYYYFGDKLGLYNEVLGHMVQESSQKIRAEAKKKTLAEKMELLTHAGTHPNSVRWQRLLSWEALEAHPTENEIVREEERRGAWLRHVSSVQAAQESGEIDPDLDPELVALALVSMAISPYVMPQVTKFITGDLPTDEGFRRRYKATVVELISRLGPRDAQSHAEPEAGAVRTVARR
jgi:TetR/AcrR family transcriptional regulator